MTAKRKHLATCCGGIGAGVCTVAMVVPIIIGTIGAGASVMGSMNGMSGNSSGSLAFWAAVNRIGQPLLIASIVVILYGMKSFGRWPLFIASIGSLMLYSSMYLLNMSFPMLALSATILATAYAIAYGPLVKRHLNY